jgi:hypothetical protein
VILSTATGSITVRPITIQANNQTKVYGDTFTFAGNEYTVPSGSVAPNDTITVSLTSTGAPAAATVAGSPYPIVPAASFASGPNSNYSITYVNGSMTIVPREGRVAYIGQTVFVTSGSSSTTTQATLTASVADIDGSNAAVNNATVTFTDLISGKVLASGVKVAPVSNAQPGIGTANTIVTLSTGNYGAQEYQIEVKLGSSYKNDQQLPPPAGTAAPGSDPYNAAHPVLVAMIPQTINSMQGAGTIPKLSTAAGKYGDATGATYSVGMTYNSKGTNPQGQIQLVLTRADGTYFIKSNSITSVAFSNPDATKLNRDVTIYTKASIYKITGAGVLTSIDGNVSLRLDAHDGCTAASCVSTNPDTIGFTILSSKDSSLYYSNNWTFDTKTLAWKTVLQPIAGTTPAVIG